MKYSANMSKPDATNLLHVLHKQARSLAPSAASQPYVAKPPIFQKDRMRPDATADKSKPALSARGAGNRGPTHTRVFSLAQEIV